MPYPAAKRTVPTLALIRHAGEACRTWLPTLTLVPAWPSPSATAARNYILAGASGTSAAAPLWAAVIAVADQHAGRDLGFVNPALYRAGLSAYYHQAFHDVTMGTNTVEFPTQTITGYHVAPGWDRVTGWGSPNAQVLITLLARYASP